MYDHRSTTNLAVPRPRLDSPPPAPRFSRMWRCPCFDGRRRVGAQAYTSPGRRARRRDAPTGAARAGSRPGPMPRSRLTGRDPVRAWPEAREAPGPQRRGRPWFPTRGAASPPLRPLTALTVRRMPGAGLAWQSVMPGDPPGLPGVTDSAMAGIGPARCVGTDDMRRVAIQAGKGGGRPRAFRRAGPAPSGPAGAGRLEAQGLEVGGRLD